MGGECGGGFSDDFVQGRAKAVDGPALRTTRSFVGYSCGDGCVSCQGQATLLPDIDDVLRSSCSHSSKTVSRTDYKPNRTLYNNEILPPQWYSLHGK